MQIKRVDKGDSVAMPLISVEKGGGVSILKSLINGILVSLKPEESSTGVIFLSEVQLNEAGYFKNMAKCDAKPEIIFHEKKIEDEKK